MNIKKLVASTALVCSPLIISGCISPEDKKAREQEFLTNRVVMTSSIGACIRHVEASLLHVSDQETAKKEMAFTCVPDETVMVMRCKDQQCQADFEATRKLQAALKVALEQNKP